MVAYGVYQIVTPEWGHGAKKIPKDLDKKKKIPQGFPQQNRVSAGQTSREVKKIGKNEFDIAFSFNNIKTKGDKYEKDCSNFDANKWLDGLQCIRRRILCS